MTFDTTQEAKAFRVPASRARCRARSPPGRCCHDNFAVDGANGIVPNTSRRPVPTYRVTVPAVTGLRIHLPRAVAKAAASGAQSATGISQDRRTREAK